MTYSSITQQAQIIAQQISGLLPGHPAISRHVPLSAITGLTPKQTVTMPAATAAGGTVTLTPGQPHLTVFFATWLTQTSDLKAELTGLNAYARTEGRDHLPPLTAVDEAVTEPVPDAARGYLKRLGTPLAYPVGVDVTGRIADGCGVQDQPWYALTSTSGKIIGINVNPYHTRVADVLAFSTEQPGRSPARPCRAGRAGRRPKGGSRELHDP